MIGYKQGIHLVNWKLERVYQTWIVLVDASFCEGNGLAAAKPTYVYQQKLSNLSKQKSESYLDES